MLFLRFLAGAGGVLLVLMFAANAYLPQPAAPVAQQQDIDHSTIRIATTRKGPERVVFDTSLPTIVPPARAAAQAEAALAPVSAASYAARDAMAQLPAEPSDRPLASAATTAPKQARLEAPKPRRHLAHRDHAPQALPPQPRQFADIFGFGSWR
jgi:hypothetical protein